MQIRPKFIEIFCGTGGVGKTTIATSRALYLAELGYKVLLITIDPAQRLKEILHLKEERAGQVERVNLEIFGVNAKPGASFDALLMSPQETFRKIAAQNNLGNEFDNRIIKILSRPFGGMNEIMAVVELNMFVEDGNYEHIILDTPPGGHFIDFLNSCRKIQLFFDDTFVDVFKYLAGKFDKAIETGKISFVKKILAGGLSKMLGYLEQVTGAKFLEEFIQALGVVYKAKDTFLKALKLQEQLTLPETTNWFLATSTEHSKLEEATFLKESAAEFLHGDSFLIINKSNERSFNEFHSTAKNYSAGVQEIMQSLETREKRVREKAKKSFEKILIFPDVLDPSPQNHVRELSQYWDIGDSHAH